jgi:hypothetical protein
MNGSGADRAPTECRALDRRELRHEHEIQFRTVIEQWFGLHPDFSEFLSGIVSWFSLRWRPDNG